MSQAIIAILPFQGTCILEMPQEAKKHIRGAAQCYHFQLLRNRQPPARWEVGHLPVVQLRSRGACERNEKMLPARKHPVGVKLQWYCNWILGSDRTDATI